jgi:hypothetical protein
MFVKQIQMQFTDIDGNGTVNLSEFCDLVNIIYATIGSPRVSKQPDPNHVSTPQPSNPSDCTQKAPDPVTSNNAQINYGNIIVDTVQKTA